MRALLDEHLSADIAVRLRSRGYDVVAVVERPDLLARDDATVLAVATLEGRAVVTSNVRDFRPLAAAQLARGKQHGRLVLLPSQRIRTRYAVAALARAIERVLQDHHEGLASSERWLGPLH